MNTGIKQLLCLSVLGLLVSCDSSNTEKVEDKVDTLTEKIETKVENALDKDDNKEFVNDAVENNKKELYFLELGQRMGTNSGLKSAAKEMAADHKKLGEEVMALASAKNIAVDDADTSNMDKDMAGRDRGADWDKDWADKMVDSHEKNIRMFEDAVDDVDDMELKALIEKALPKLRHHLEMAKALQDKLKK